jgi:cystathionine beta-synthase
MRQADVSQLPVLDGERLVGLLDESDLLARLHADATAFGASVQSAMNTDVITLAPTASLTELNEQLRRGLVAVIADDAGFHGLVTRFDLINHLRKEVAR